MILTFFSNIVFLGYFLIPLDVRKFFFFCKLKMSNVIRLANIWHSQYFILMQILIFMNFLKFLHSFEDNKFMYFSDSCIMVFIFNFQNFNHYSFHLQVIILLFKLMTKSNIYKLVLKILWILCIGEWIYDICSWTYWNWVYWIKYEKSIGKNHLYEINKQIFPELLNIVFCFLLFIGKLHIYII